MVVLFGSERMPALEPIIEGDELDPVVEAGGETGDDNIKIKLEQHNWNALPHIPNCAGKEKRGGPQNYFSNCAMPSPKRAA